MRREAVDSEAIASIAYEPRTCELEIRFRESGHVYRYFQVSPDEHREFINAESKGRYLNRVFKPKKHPYRVVKRGPK